MLRKSLLASLILAAGSAPALAETYVIDPTHTQVRFGYSHFGLSDIVGIFSGITGEIVYDPAKPEASSVKASIPIADVHTGVAKMDDHLRAADFFDVASFPTASFTSSKVEAAGEGKLKVTGELQVRDIRREVVPDDPARLDRLQRHHRPQAHRTRRRQVRAQRQRRSRDRDHGGGQRRGGMIRCRDSGLGTRVEYRRLSG